MSEYVRFIQRIGLVGLTNILISLSSLIFIPIITKSFTTAEYGMWAQVNTTIALVPNIANLGLPYTMVRFLSAEKDKEKIKDSFYPMISLTFISTLIICSLFLIFGNTIANALFNGSMQVLYITTAISFFACMNLMLISYFRTFQQMKRYSLFLVLQSYIGVFVSIYLTYAGYNIETVVLGLLTGYVAVFIMMAFLIVKYLGIGIGKWSNLKEQLAFALPTIPSNVSSWVVDSSDKYVIGILIGSVAVGCYSPGYALGSILLMFLSPFAVLLPAVLPEYYEKGDIGEVDKYLSYSMKYYLLLTIPAAVGMSVLSKPLLYIITTGNSFRLPWSNIHGNVWNYKQYSHIGKKHHDSWKVMDCCSYFKYSLEPIARSLPKHFRSSYCNTLMLHIGVCSNRNCKQENHEIAIQQKRAFKNHYCIHHYGNCSIYDASNWNY